MIIYIGLVLLFTNFMSYVGPGSDHVIVGRVNRFLLLFLIPIILMNSTKFPKTTLYKCCMWLMFFQLLSMLGAYVLHGQSFDQSFVVTSYAFVYLMFPLMYILKLDEKSIIKLFFVLGLWWVAVMFIQQFTYPFYLFCNTQYHEEGGPSMRNGIVRYGTAGGVFGLLMLFYAFQKYLEEGKRKYLVWIIIGIVGVYLTCTRQTMAASAGCLLVGMYLKGKIKIGAVIGIAAVGLIIYHYVDVLFGEYAEMTSNDLNKDYIRIYAYRFYGLEYNKGNIFAMLIGNGLFREGSSYANEMEHYRADYGLFQSDVGLVGEYSLHGIFYVLTILYIFYYVFKNRKYIDLYLQLYMLYTAVTSVMLMPFRCSLGTFGTLLVLYLIDLSMVKNKKAEYLKRQKAYEIQHNSAGI